MKNLLKTDESKYLGGVILVTGIFHLGTRLGFLAAEAQLHIFPVLLLTGIAIAGLLLSSLRLRYSATNRRIVLEIRGIS